MDGTFWRSASSEKRACGPQKACVEHIGDLPLIVMMYSQESARHGNKHIVLLVMPRLYSALTSSDLNSIA
jgi:hypothetical protein